MDRVSIRGYVDRETQHPFSRVLGAFLGSFITSEETDWEVKSRSFLCEHILWITLFLFSESRKRGRECETYVWGGNFSRTCKDWLLNRIVFENLNNKARIIAWVDDRTLMDRVKLVSDCWTRVTLLSMYIKYQLSRVKGEDKKERMEQETNREVNHEYGRKHFRNG